MAGCDGLEGGLEVGEGLHAVDLAGLDQGGDAAPGFAALVMTGKESILAIQSQFPFILPMSGRFIEFIIDGMPILTRT